MGAAQTVPSNERSNNHRKQRAIVAKAYAKLRHYRDNFQHQLSHRLIEENQFIGMETLMVRNMTRKARKRLDADGKPMRNGQSRKRAMNRSILRDGWSASWPSSPTRRNGTGRAFVQVDRFYPSSKLCHDCGHKYKGIAAVRTRMDLRKTATADMTGT